MNPSSSSPSSPPPSGLGVGKPNPSKLLLNLRRSFSYSGPKSTRLSDEEMARESSRHRTSDPDPAETRPTIEQISMGLHLSRTPHIPVHLSHLTPVYPPLPHPRSHSHDPRPRRTSHNYSPCSARVAPRLPPPPERSALKKISSSPSTSPQSRPASALTMTSASSAPSSSAPSTPSASSTRSRFARFLGVRQRETLGRHGESKAEVVVADVRKAVRFEEFDIDE